jgi:hypothetical protein
MNHETIATMRQRALSLRPHDVAAALQLTLEPELPYGALADRLKISLGEAHNAVRRLKSARLVGPGEKRVAIAHLLEFLAKGVPYAFPAELGPVTRGIPTAHSAPPLIERFGAAADPVVWPSAHGTTRGASIVPLYPAAPELLDSNRPLYELLALTDALRIGQIREQKMAIEVLTERLRPSRQG